MNQDSKFVEESEKGPEDKVKSGKKTKTKQTKLKRIFMFFKFDKSSTELPDGNINSIEEQLISPRPISNISSKISKRSRFLQFFSKDHSIAHEHVDSCSESTCTIDEPCVLDIKPFEFDILRDHVEKLDAIEDVCFHRKYRFLPGKPIGKGASGLVKKGQHLNDEHNTLAIKEFRLQRRGENIANYLEKIAKEFQISSSLCHKNIVDSMDIVRDGKRWYNVMEYCQRGDLFAAIQKGKLSDMSDIDCCLSQLVHGVNFIHSKGVAHRDLKPENILIDAHGWLKITDFGVSISFTEECSCRGLCGSSPYIAPEEYCEGSYDVRKVDVWALGIVYYAMIFHGVPWERAMEKDANYKHFTTCDPQHDFEPFSRLGHGSKSLLCQMIEPDPNKRISIEEILMDPWFKKIKYRPLNLN